MQAKAGEGLDVPPDELLEAIYLTPDYGFALAMAARPKGVTTIDNNAHTIEFERPELFDPEKEVYVYEIDIPKNETKVVDELQAAVENKDELKPDKMFTHKAGDVEQYYELTNWPSETEVAKNTELKLK